APLYPQWVSDSCTKKKSEAATRDASGKGVPRRWDVDGGSEFRAAHPESAETYATPPKVNSFIISRRCSSRGSRSGGFIQLATQ
ncbi:MAG TPA: hypothetical protein VIV60_17445, partial [Polyangiaceae bacterium]